MPVSSCEWERTTKTYLVSYLVKELGRGDMFGLDELHKIAMLKLEKKSHGHIRRKLRILASENTQLLYTTAASFYKLFGEVELIRITRFVKEVDLEAIKTTVELDWQMRKALGKGVVMAAKQSNSK